MVNIDGVNFTKCCLDSGRSFLKKQNDGFFWKILIDHSNFLTKKILKLSRLNILLLLDSKSSVLLSCRPGPEEKLQGGLTLNILYSL